MAVGMALAGRIGALLTDTLGMAASWSTLLRLIAGLARSGVSGGTPRFTLSGALTFLRISCRLDDLSRCSGPFDAS